jgi:hypothetical protein
MYYMRFISGFAHIAKSLTRLTEEKRMFEWSTETKTAFQALKDALCTVPVLGYPRAGEKFSNDTDAKSVGIGCSLSSTRFQRVLAYFSNHLSKAERNYYVTRRELLAIAKHFHKYLYGQEFHLRTDQSALTWLLSFRNLKGQTTRWVHRLQYYYFTPEHHGIRHTSADALSKRPRPEECLHCQKV